MRAALPFQTVRMTGSGGLNLVADSGGAADSPLVVLSHGGGQTRFSWSRSRDILLGNGFAVLSYDHRGHGESDWSAAGEYEVRHYVADLESVLDQHARHRPVALVGASLGGIASLIVAARHPGTVSALVMVDVSPNIQRAGADRIRNFMAANPSGFSTVEEAADAVAAYRADRPRPKDLSGLMRNLRLRSETGRYHWHWDPRILEGMTPDSRAPRSNGMIEACRTLQVPVLLVRGVQSDVVTLADVEHFRELVPGLAVADVAESGHMVVGDRNDAFLQAILNFLARVRPAEMGVSDE